jgi:glucose dehydrogenase
LRAACHGSAAAAVHATGKSATGKSAASSHSATASTPDRDWDSAGSWPMWQYNLSGSRFAPRTPINPGNVGQLTEKWAFTFPVRDGPAVVRDTVYFGDSRGYLFALNARTGALRWATLLDTTNPDVELTGSPIVCRGLVYIGVSNKEAGYQSGHRPG